jgi:small GTP-binding protein
MDFSQDGQIFRVVILGESSVGKTSIINRLVNKEFNPVEQATVGAAFLLHQEKVDGFAIEMQIWDTAGQEKYKSLSPIYCRGAAAAVVAFDITNHRSFEKLDDWATLVTEVAGADTAIFIVANKCDLSPTVDEREIEAWIASRGFTLVRTSAKTGEGVTELSTAVAEALFRKGSANRPATRLPPIGGNGAGQRCC